MQYPLLVQENERFNQIQNLLQPQILINSRQIQQEQDGQHLNERQSSKPG